MATLFQKARVSAYVYRDLLKTLFRLYFSMWFPFDSLPFCFVRVGTWLCFCGSLFSFRTLVERVYCTRDGENITSGEGLERTETAYKSLPFLSSYFFLSLLFFYSFTFDFFSRSFQNQSHISYSSSRALATFMRNLKSFFSSFIQNVHARCLTHANASSKRAFIYFIYLPFRFSSCFLEL